MMLSKLGLAWRRIHWPDVLLAVAGAVGAVAMGLYGSTDSKAAIAIAVFTILFLVAIRGPVNIAILALLGQFFGQRLGGSTSYTGASTGVSYADALLGIASVLAIASLVRTRELTKVRPALIGLAIYLASILPSVILNASHRALQEFAHRSVLVGGAILVGAWIVHQGATRLALRWFAALATLMAILAMEWSLRHGFAPASPMGLNKNYIGSQLGAAVVLIIVARPTLRLPTKFWLPIVVTVGGGLLATQSRGAQLGAALGLLIVFLLSARSRGRRGRLVSVVVTVALAWFAIASIRHQAAQDQAVVNNGSIGVRINTEAATRAIWHTSPIYGVGLKYFYTSVINNRFAVASNNAINNELAESGVIGAAGWIVMQALCLATAWRRRHVGSLVLAGLAVASGMVLHGMVDIYWTAGVASLPFIFLGMGLASSTRSSTLESTSEKDLVDPGKDAVPLVRRRGSRRGLTQGVATTQRGV